MRALRHLIAPSLRVPRGRRGAAAAEFALTAPILVVLLLSTIEYGNYFSQLAAVNNATVQACRWGASQPGAARIAHPTPDAAAEAAALQLLNDIQFVCPDLDTCGIDATLDAGGTPPSVELVVSVPYTQITGILPNASSISFATPSLLNARASFPLVGNN